MDFLTNLAQGFQIGLLPINLLYCFTGVLLGTLIGVLPGIGPSATIALLLPTTFRISPVSAIIMLAGIYYGAQYGGSTTSILVNIPGEAASVVTCLDGYQMARKGRAGPALGISAFGSFIAGTLSVLGLMVLAVPLSSIALKFGFPEYFAIMCLGLSIVSYLGRGSFFKSLLMAVVGVSISFIGMDIVVGKPRFDFGLLVLGDGVGLIPLLMGLFGIAEVFSNLERKTQTRDVFQTKIEGLLPNRKDWKDSWGAILRGSVLGFLLGILPGGGAVVASFLSYAVERKVSKHPERLGSGVIEGVAGPESANNSATGGGLHSPLCLGNSLQRGHGHAPGSADDPRAPAGAPFDPGSSGNLLGNRGQHVYRQHRTPGAQSPPHWFVGEAPESPLQGPFSHDPALLYDRGLQHEQQPRRHAGHAFLRGPRLFIAEIRI
jgi:putative tricarboxylic transport membrane protein